MIDPLRKLLMVAPTRAKTFLLTARRRFEIPCCLVWLGFLRAILLNRYYWLLFSRPRLADRRHRTILYLRPHVWRKRGIRKRLHLVSNADAATQQNKFSSNVNIVVMTRMRDHLFHVARRCTVFHHLHATGIDVRRTLRANSAILALDRTRDNAPHTAEG
ncbi:hypothetical protein [Bradyrhizobium valentinum]|uniref:hypothetical protein n=1 Tax=Bradyrhizobium valentinum TaxID=1518501 RepID=UPI0012E35A23|nr:hypothetical protein [Bradyrhizobium valentinum]